MELKKAQKSFWKNGKEIKILDDVNISFEKNKFYLIIGESGAGKSTLINILGLLDKLDAGDLIISSKNVNNLNDKELSLMRLKEIGLIFQDYYLNPRLNAKDNILIATLINKDIKEQREELIEKKMAYLQILDRKNHYPHELSGGERQRVCIARALINEPNYILADEPTGALDEVNAKKVMEILKKLSENGKSVIMVTHDYRNCIYADEIYRLNHGKLVKENKNDFLKKYS